MTIKMLFATAATLALLGTSAGYAQTPAPAMDKPAAAATDKPSAAAKAKPARTAKSLECSKQADEKQLHGKPRGGGGGAGGKA